MNFRCESTHSDLHVAAIRTAVLRDTDAKTRSQTSAGNKSNASSRGSSRSRSEHAEDIRLAAAFVGHTVPLAPYARSTSSNLASFIRTRDANVDASTTRASSPHSTYNSSPLSKFSAKLTRSSTARSFLYSAALSFPFPSASTVVDPASSGELSELSDGDRSFARRALRASRLRRDAFRNSFARARASFPVLPMRYFSDTSFAFESGVRGASVASSSSSLDGARDDRRPPRAMTAGARVRSGRFETNCFFKGILFGTRRGRRARGS